MCSASGAASTRRSPRFACRKPWQSRPSVFRASSLPGRLLHILAANLPEQAGNGEAAAYMPIAVKAYQLFAPPSRELTSHVTMRGHAACGEILECDADLDGAGRLVIEVDGLKLKHAHPAIALA